MNARAYYNEIDAYAAQWLRNLIAAGHIAPGEVDERSIVDVRPSDLDGFTQCHFFAGIGVWSYALRLADWPDDRPVWTGSCPCQPFSAAGKGGGFADERHLWPAFFHLIGECRPSVVLGEQVASRDGLDWLDLVQDDMEGAGYAFGAVDTSSALHGAPHIRQRLRWSALADADRERRGREHPLLRWPEAGGWVAAHQPEAARSSKACDLADTPGGEQWRIRERGSSVLGREQPDRGYGSAHLLGDPGGPGLPPRERESVLGTGRREEGRAAQQSGRASGELANDTFGRRREERADAGRDAAGDRAQGLAARSQSSRMLGHNRRPGPTNGFWRDPDWLFCRDGRWRPVEPGTFPLAHGAPARVGRLRAYGNAVDAEATAAFIRCLP